MRGMLRRPSDVVFAGVVLAFTALAASVWWLSDIVPGMDYPQFLVFVRAVRDYRDPTSPFHGTYTTGPWITPTGLPVHLTVALSYLCGRSIEAASKLLLTLQNVGLVVTTLLLLKILGRPRWAVALLFPIIHSSWSVVGGLASFFTALPLVILGWALTVAWLRRLDLVSAIALAACLCVTLLWHGIAYAQLGLGFAVLLCLWRAPSWRARLLAVVPTFPSLVQYAVWVRLTFAAPSNREDWAWLRPVEAAESMMHGTAWAQVPNAPLQEVAFVVLVGMSLSVATINAGASGGRGPRWLIQNPFLVLSLVYLVGYFALPIGMSGVAGFSNRFVYLSELAFVFAWNLPAERCARAGVLVAAFGLSAWCLEDIAHRFRLFQAETRGASALMNRVGPRETLYYDSGPDDGYSPAFAPGNKAMRELEQFASARSGGLPNTSFAGYGYTYVRFVNGSPMPGLSGPPSWSPPMTKFDYVLVRGAHLLADAHFRWIDGRYGWELYGVCGSARFPSCG
jgi:hypothetical protein